MGIIYKATNMITNKCYIGQSTTSLERRIANHRWASKNKKTIFYDAIRSYGWDSFKWEVLLECEIESLDYYEVELISAYRTRDRKYGYNDCEGGHSGGFGGKRHTKEWKYNMSKRQTGTTRPESMRKKLRKPKTIEHRRKLSETRKRMIQDGLIKCTGGPVMFGKENPSYKVIKIISVKTGEIKTGSFTEFKKAGFVTTMMYSGSVSKSGWKIYSDESKNVA